MASTSIVAAARAALVDAIEAALPGVQVEYGAPPEDRQRREFVAITTSVTGEHDDTTLKADRRKRMERTETTVTVMVSSKSTPRAAEARVAELLAAVEDILADDPKLGGVDGLIAAVPARLTLDSGYGTDAHPVSVGELTIEMTGYLR